MNYADLCTTVQDTVENGFEPDMLATWARLVEQKVYNTVQIPALRKNTFLTAVAGVPQMTLPADFLYALSIAVVDSNGDYKFLIDKDTNYIRQVYPNVSTRALPKVYALLNATTLLMGPTPDAAYQVEMEYGHYPESIVTAGTTWLGDNYDSVLLNGMLIEAARFLKSDKDVVELYVKMFNEAMAGFKQLGDGKLRQDAYRSGQVRTAVQ